MQEAGRLFIDRRTQLSRLEQFARTVRDGTPERHLAFLGVRRIGKSRLVERFRDLRHGVAIVSFETDEAATTLQAFLLEIVRATIAAVAVHVGQPPPTKRAAPLNLLAAAAGVSEDAATLTRDVLSLLDQRKPDGQMLFSSAAGFPAEFAQATGTPLIVCADEFQKVLDLAIYAPFSAGRARKREEAEEMLLHVFRPAVEGRAHCGWVITGSSIRVLMRVLEEGPLNGRFDIELLRGFGADDAQEQAAATWRALDVEATETALRRMYELTLGHPFYVDVACRESALAGGQLGRNVSAATVEGAFMDSILQPSGQIARICREMYQSLEERAPALKGFINALAALEEPAAVTDIAAAIPLTDVPPAYNYADDLVNLGLIEEIEGLGRRYRFVDPVFRYWVCNRVAGAVAEPVIGDPDAAARLARDYEEAFLKAREQAGTLTEGYVRDLCRNFSGQKLEGWRFGVPGVHVSLPHVDDVRRVVAFDESGKVFGTPSEVELDLYFGSDEVWLGEIRNRTRRASAQDIDKLAKKDSFLRAALGLRGGPTWFISASGFEAKALEAAKGATIYTSTLRDLEAIRNQVGSIRP